MSTQTEVLTFTIKNKESFNDFKDIFKTLSDTKQKQILSLLNFEPEKEFQEKLEIFYNTNITS